MYEGVVAAEGENCNGSKVSKQTSIDHNDLMRGQGDITRASGVFGSLVRAD